MNDTLILTPSALFSFLSQIPELSGKEIQVQDNGSSIKVSIGDAQYVLQPDTVLSEVDAEVVDAIDEINEDGYVTAEDQPVEGGLIKELIKTLAIGGLVRLTKSALTS